MSCIKSAAGTETDQGEDIAIWQSFEDPSQTFACECRCACHECGLGAAHQTYLPSQVEAGGLLPKGVLEAVKEAKVERKLGSAMHMGMHSNLTDSARLGEHLFGIPQARKGWIGGVCVVAVLSLGLAVMLKGYVTKKRTRRRRLQSV